MGYRSKTLVSLLGVIHLERAYYHCRHCQSGLVPWDQTLRLSSEALTPAAREVVCMAGVLSSFAEAATLSLPKLSGLRVSESTVERVTEGTGQDVGDRLASGRTFGSPRTWQWHRDAEGKTCAYVSLDATGVRRQGLRGGKAEGRMVTVAMVYNPVPEQRERWARPEACAPRFDVRYLAGLNGIAVLGEPLRRQAGQVGMDQAERWIALSDGGAGLEDWLQTYFGRVEAVILDFYHATEYLAELGRALSSERRSGPRQMAGKLVSPPKARRWGLRARRSTSAGSTRSCGLQGEGRGGTVFHESSAPNGLPELPRERLVDWLRTGRVGVQDGDWPTDERGRDAVGRTRRR